ncbi:ABC transporter permease [Nocardioides albus]|uniref:Peptide/nickel transport system permease protein n=1 Tax=Nocardioides albus TaxID=1841 RepID=A0A7W5A9N2_9ACTN|nr:ABC transporter permease [Nocardioides albus]MBB3091784.1 peptide/nickel transport system permease protein [Nocardioides albus]
MSLSMARLEAETPEPGDVPVEKSAAIVGKSPTQIALGRLRKDKTAVVCIAVLVVVIALAVLAPVITSILDIHERREPGSLNAAEWTDQFGYPVTGPPYYGFDPNHPLGISPKEANDNLARLLYGVRNSLFIGAVVAFSALLIGTTIGLAAGFSRGWLDRILSFVIDLFLAFPFFFFAMALSPIIGNAFSQNDVGLAVASFIGLIIFLIIFSWMSLARLVRGQVISLREREFILAAEVIGVPMRRVLFKELLPNLVAPLVVWFSVAVPTAVALEVALTLLGLGVSGTPTLGLLVQEARGYWDTYPLYLWTPVGAVVVITLALNLLGDSVRDAFDPKTRR